MTQIQNTLYVTTHGSYLSKDGENILVKSEGNIVMRVPVHVLDGIVCIGRIMISPALMGHCMKHGLSISFLTENGYFLGRVVGSVSGNVLLRREQYRHADDPIKSFNIAKNIVIGKILNQRTVLDRALRDYNDVMHINDRDSLCATKIHFTQAVQHIQNENNIDVLRGIEGESAKKYFGQFNTLIRTNNEEFRFIGRSRRPPLDRINSMMSFVYTLLTHDIRSALESVGLDPTVGFLHTDRPGRLGLALDILEEFRPWFCDRLVISLINRKQIHVDDFIIMPDGACMMTAAGRKILIMAYQKRKRDPIKHGFLDEKSFVGIMWHLQAKLLARYLRKDLDEYPPFLWR
ncbi:MAG: CRISPR-associated protein Cas1 [Cenarchaeum symbiont of Oopsacas minuta]|nr:CRISPR-associated protein Cas1 [Cenarchaeum symbiont of Oopsacas minuta]